MSALKAILPRLPEIKALAEKATPGPWVCEVHQSAAAAHEENGSFEWCARSPEGWAGRAVAQVWRRTSSGGETGLPGCVETTASNAVLIAAARTDVPALVEALEEARELLAEVQQELFDWISESRCDEVAERHPMVRRIREALGQ